MCYGFGCTLLKHPLIQHFKILCVTTLLLHNAIPPICQVFELFMLVCMVKNIAILRNSDSERENVERLPSLGAACSTQVISRDKLNKQNCLFFELFLS